MMMLMMTTKKAADDQTIPVPRHLLAVGCVRIHRILANEILGSSGLLAKKCAKFDWGRDSR